MRNRPGTGRSRRAEASTRRSASGGRAPRCRHAGSSMTRRTDNSRGRSASDPARRDAARRSARGSGGSDRSWASRTPCGARSPAERRARSRSRTPRRSIRARGRSRRGCARRSARRCRAAARAPRGSPARSPRSPARSTCPWRRRSRQRRALPRPARASRRSRWRRPGGRACSSCGRAASCDRRAPRS